MNFNEVEIISIF